MIEEHDELLNEDDGSQETITKVTGMYKEWFLDYASYVILERAVPAIEDGFKPVQRRIMHSMKDLDDGRYNKVANIVGHNHAISSSWRCKYCRCHGSDWAKRLVNRYSGELGKYLNR